MWGGRIEIGRSLEIFATREGLCWHLILSPKKSVQWHGERHVSFVSIVAEIHKLKLWKLNYWCLPYVIPESTLISCTWWRTSPYPQVNPNLKDQGGEMVNNEAIVKDLQILILAIFIRIKRELWEYHQLMKEEILIKRELQELTN